MSKVEEGKFVKMFSHDEIRLTACAVTKHVASSSLLWLSEFNGYFGQPNQFWQRNPNHERALLKIYKRNPEKNVTYNVTYIDNYGKTQILKKILKIPMFFWGSNSSDSWGELQFLIKEPKLVSLARHRSFDTRVNKWVEETQLIKPKTDLETHAYLALRFYHHDYLPTVPGAWYWETLYISIRKLNLYKIDVSWEKEEIKITTTVLEENSPEIPKHLK